MSICTHKTKHGVRCKMAAARKDRCMYHQPEEIIRRLIRQIERLDKQKAKVVERLQKEHNATT